MDSCLVGTSHRRTSSDGLALEIRSVQSSQLVWSTIICCTKEQNLGSTAGATAVLRYPAILLVPWFLVSWFSLWLPGSRFFLFCLWCCSESEDSVNLLRIQRSDSLCDLVLFFLYVEFISSHDALHSVHNSLYLHTLPRSKLPQ